MSRLHIIDVPGLAPSPSPISNAVVVGNQCWISGQLGVGDDGRLTGTGTLDEARVAFDNLFRVASAAGFSRDDIVFVEIAFLDLADIGDVNRLYAELFAEGARPARTVYQAAALPMGARVKVQAVAVRA